MRKHMVSSRLFLLLTLAAAAGQPAAAELREVQLEVHPAAPTWREEVTVTVRGESDCLVELHGSSRDFVQGLGSVLRIEVEESCLPDSPGFQPFHLTVELGKVQCRPFQICSTGSYPVLLTRVGEEETVLEQSELIIYEEADVEIEVLAAPPTDAAPFVIRMSGVTATCHGAAGPAEVEGDVIRLHFPDGCFTLPPEGHVQSFDVTIGPLAAGDYEVRVFRGSEDPPLAVSKAAIHVFDHELCLPESDVLCLNQDRFAVSVRWEDFQGGSGAGQALPFREDTGLFWFFDPENVELTIKVLEACPVNGFFWVFAASGSTVGYEIRVTDTTTEETVIYRNDLGEVPRLIPDTAAFACP